MRHPISKTFSFLALVLALASCSERGNYMAFTDNVVYVKAFPEEYSLTGAEEVDAGVLGVLSLKIMDSLLVHILQQLLQAISTKQIHLMIIW